MRREFRYLEDKNIVLIRTSGTYDLDAEIETLKKVAAKLKEYNCNKCIFDHRETNVIARPMSSYERPAVYEELWDDHSTRGALVVKEINKDLKFLETVVRNRGWVVRIFDDYDKAMEWLS